MQLASIRMKNALEKLPDREAIVAGRFYPSSAEELEAEVSGYLDASAKMHDFHLEGGEEISAIIVPHAGYVFSGKVAASAYKLLEDSSYSTVFLIGSSHHALIDRASVYHSGSYLSPIGSVSVNSEVACELLEHKKVFGYYPEAHEKEHSLEVQLPFLRLALPDQFEIVPIIIGTQSVDMLRKIAAVLEPYLNDPENLFVISTDLSHYPSYNEAKKVDKATIEVLCKNSPNSFRSYIRSVEHRPHSDLATGMCGWTSVLTLLYMTEGKEKISYKPVLYQNSGDIPVYGDKSHVVGYQSLVITRRHEIVKKAFSLSQEEKKELLRIADESIRKTIGDGGSYASAQNFGGAKLSGKQGAFVSIYIDGKLRGCIGRIETDDPLYKTVEKMAAAAATSDNRFRSVSRDELDKIELEISVLSPLQKISSPEEIKPGRHGILIRKGLSSGTFLPQVADKTGWDAVQMLEECSDRKAGLGKDGWRDADVYTYEAIVFSKKHT